jgi:hypothetical protein
MLDHSSPGPGPLRAGWQATLTLPVGYTDPGAGKRHRVATLRKMTGNEEALLVDPKLRANGGKLITALLASCITDLDGVAKVTPDIVRNLASADRNHLLLELRRLTFGDQLEAHYRCPRCQHTNDVPENLAELETREAPDEPGELEIVVQLADGYQDTDGRFHFDLAFRYPTGEDEEAAAGRRDANASRQRDVLLSRCLLRVGDMEPRRIAAIGTRIFASLSMADRRTIQRALDNDAPGTSLVRSIVCDGCGEEFRTTLDMSHFFPLA